MIDRFDALNNLTSADDEEIKEQITQYFEEMELDEEEVEKRIGLAVDIEKGFRNLFILMLTAEIVGEALEDRRDDFIDFVYHDYMDAMIDNGYSNDTYYSGVGYIEQYARTRCTEVVDTAILHKADDYYFTVEHSLAIGEDEGNAVGNYYREQMMIARGMRYKTWVAMKDNRVRHTHERVDGRTIGIFEAFTVGNSQLMFPCDKSLNASQKEIANCRCVLHYSK